MKSLISKSLCYHQIFPFALKPIKSVPAEPYLEVQKPEKSTKSTKYPDIEIKIKKYNKKEHEEHTVQLSQEKAIPCTPIIGPITVIMHIHIYIVFKLHIKKLGFKA